MVKQIELTRGKYALVDDDDFDALNQYLWFFYPQGYAARQDKRNGDKRILIHMHRVVMNAPDNMQVDHINGDTLDNRKSNLRLCTHAENVINRPGRPGSSKFKGVTLDKRRGRWYARHAGTHIGSFTDEVDAALAYDEYVKNKFGDFAWLNFPDSEQFDRELYRQALEYPTVKSKPRKPRQGQQDRRKRAKRVEVECAYCGAAMVRTEHYATRNKRNFCSRSCASTFYNLRRPRDKDGNFAKSAE